MPVSTYATLINQRVIVPSNRTAYVAVEKDHLVDFLKPTLQRIRFDEAWYLQQNPDIADAIRNGTIQNAAEHYLRSGYFEHRMPYAINVDEEWYLTQYPDVKEAVEKGRFTSATEHFSISGFREGRLPFAGFAMEEG